MFVDFHTHIFPDKLAEKTVKYLAEKGDTPNYAEGTRASLLSSMEAGGIDLSIALPVATASRQFDSINRFAAEVNAEYFDPVNQRGILSFGGIHPDSEDYKGQLRRISELGLSGIKLHPVYQRVQFDDIRYMRLVDYASELGLCVVTHAGFDVGYPGEDFVSPAAIRRLVETVHPDRLVLAHMGGWTQWDEVEQELAGLPVYLDTSYSMDQMKQEDFLRLVRLHGADHVVFATDSPWADQGQQAEYLTALPLTEEELQLITWKNAYRILGFSTED